MGKTAKDRMTRRSRNGKKLHIQFDFENIREETILENFAEIWAKQDYKAMEKMLENYDAFVEIR